MPQGQLPAVNQRYKRRSASLLILVAMQYLLIAAST